MKRTHTCWEFGIDGVGAAFDTSYIDQFSKSLQEQIELALIFQLSLIHGRVISPAFLRSYAIKEVHPNNNSWLYKYRGIPLVQVTPPSFKLLDNFADAYWKVECLPFNAQEAARIGPSACWRDWQRSPISFVM